MPNNPASTTPPNTAHITYTDNHLAGLQQSVASNLQNAGVKVPYEAVKPVHVPDARPENLVDEEKIKIEQSVPGSFNSTPSTALSPLKTLSEHLDYADQIVTGRTHVIDEAHRFTQHKNEKEDKKMKFKNEPGKKNFVQNIVDWFYDENKV